MSDVQSIFGGTVKPSGDERPITTRDLARKRHDAERESANRRQKEQRDAIAAKQEAARAEQAKATQERISAAAAERRAKIEKDVQARFYRHGGTPHEWALHGTTLVRDAIRKAAETEEAEAQTAVRRSYAKTF